MPDVRAESERMEAVRRFVDSHPADVVIHAMSIRLAKQCREVIQVLLREQFADADADREFYLVIRAGLEELEAARRGKEVADGFGR